MDKGAIVTFLKKCDKKIDNQNGMSPSSGEIFLGDQLEHAESHYFKWVIKYKSQG